MPNTVRPEATISAYGDLSLDRDEYGPLDTVVVTVVGRAKRDDACFIRVEDADQNVYFDSKIPLQDNRGTISFPAAGKLGTHWVYLRFPGDEKQNVATACVPPGEQPIDTDQILSPLYYAQNFGRADAYSMAPQWSETGPDNARNTDWHVRYANFVLDAQTVVRSGDESIDSLYDITRRRMLLNRRVFDLEDGPLAYYCSSDTWCTSVAWLRDWIYHAPAARFWECDAAASIDHFLNRPFDDGMMPDNVGFDGQTTNQPVESDAEYVAVMAVWDIWRVNGDNDWMAARLAVLEGGLNFTRTDPMRWDEQKQLVTRAHTCDTWDFEIGGDVEFVGDRKVIAICDQTGYYLAYRMMAEMYAALNNQEKSDDYTAQAEDLKQRTNELLWDGGKYQHHAHITPLEHPGFDETKQLAAGNTWAMTRGLAEQKQAVAIIDEYKRRHEETGDAYPWWSLQPGYPDDLNYWPGAPCLIQGGYANGGLLPYVGGGLCLSSFIFGRERYGVELLKQYTDLLKSSGNRVYVWYWTNGEPGMRTANEVPRAGWGMSEWLMALLEGLAGFTDTAPRMNELRLEPRWAATDRTDAYVCVRYAINDSYFAYRMTIDKQQRQIILEYTGNGEKLNLHVLLPDDWKAQSVTSDDGELQFKNVNVEQSPYVDFTDKINGHRRIVIKSA
jgi:hypothetical protein